MSTLPKDSVFRSVLEYHSPKFLLLRYSPLEDRKRDRHFPATEELSYDNYLVAISEKPDDFGFKFTLLTEQIGEDGQQSTTGT